MSFPNPEQAAVIEAVQESLLVLAPMGTGKTRTAAAAIHRALATGIKPERVLGLTFTNRAAEAMRAAVAGALPGAEGIAVGRVQLFNLHGLCARLLREERTLADLPPDFGILDEDESAELLWQFIPRAEREKLYRNKPVQALNEYEKFVFNFLMGDPVGPTPSAFRLYRDALHRDGSVDFTGLIARAYRVLKTDAAARERWQARHDWLLVDEVQDINLAEYRIIALLAGKCRCVKFFGDTHQTIYEWRFAQPREVLDAFAREFQPGRLTLRVNYRCSPVLVEATNAMRRRFIPSDEPFPVATGDPSDGQITLQTFETAGAETAAVVAQLAAWRKRGIPCDQIAVLTRQNRTLVEISAALRAADIPHLAAEDYDFFRRQEVKDVAAILGHLVCPFRRQPILRLVKRFGATQGALEALEKTMQGTGLHLGHLVRGAAGDPLQPLLEAWRAGRLVALDTETTGLDPAVAEVIQLARIPIDRVDAATEPVVEWIKPAGKVGQSIQTHGISDDFLAAHGRDARAVFERGLRFDTGTILLGHNLAFDLRLLRSHAARLGMTPSFPPAFDTMPLAAACLEKDRLAGLRLESVAAALGVDLARAHDAAADARACLSILERLLPRLQEMQPARMKIIADMGSELGLAFRKVARLLHQAVEAEAGEPSVQRLIPAVWTILRDTPGLHDYASNPARTRNIEDLAAIAPFLEKRRGHPLSLPDFLEQVALSRRDMVLEAGPDRVRLLTAHAAKGLEFAAVALPRLVKGWSGYSDEEARVFYVMLTRARQHLWLSWPRVVRTPFGTEAATEKLKYLSAIEPYTINPPGQNDG